MGINKRRRVRRVTHGVIHDLAVFYVVSFCEFIDTYLPRQQTSCITDRTSNFRIAT